MSSWVYFLLSEKISQNSSKQIKGLKWYISLKYLTHAKKHEGFKLECSSNSEKKYLAEDCPIAGKNFFVGKLFNL